MIRCRPNFLSSFVALSALLCLPAVAQNRVLPAFDAVVALTPTLVGNAPCSRLGRIKSIDSDQPISIVFVNQTGAFRALQWIDFNGELQDVASLNPGERKTIKTFVTHPWMVTDGPGNCQEIFVAKRGSKRFNLRAVVTGGGD
jgi:hypothetical protein